MNNPEWMLDEIEAWKLSTGNSMWNTGQMCKHVADEAQKKLLEYLIKTHAVQFMDIDGHTVSAVLTYHHQSILKQLGNQDAT